MNQGTFIELLHFRVEPHSDEAFLAHNYRWLLALQRQPGFLTQRTYRDAAQPDLWLVLIEWQDEAAMFSFPADLQRQLDADEGADWTLEAADRYWGVER